MKIKKNKFGLAEINKPPLVRFLLSAPDPTRFLKGLRCETGNKKSIHIIVSDTFQFFFTQAMKCSFKNSLKETCNLVPRVRSLLYLYSGIQEAVRQFDSLKLRFTWDKLLRNVKILLETTFFTHFSRDLLLFSDVRIITSLFIFEAAV